MSRHVFRAQDYVEHMLDACARIALYIAGKSLEDFLADKLTQDAVTRNLEILGEASKQLRDVLPDAQERFPSLPFRSLYSLRNRMIHAYALTNYNVISSFPHTKFRNSLARSAKSWLFGLPT